MKYILALSLKVILCFNAFSQPQGEIYFSVLGHFDSLPYSKGPSFLLSIMNISDSVIMLPTIHTSAPAKSIADVEYQIFEIKNGKLNQVNTFHTYINDLSRNTTIQLDREDSYLYLVEVTKGDDYFKPKRKYMIKFYLKKYSVSASYTFYSK